MNRTEKKEIDDIIEKVRSNELKKITLKFGGTLGELWTIHTNSNAEINNLVEALLTASKPASSNDARRTASGVSIPKINIDDWILPMPRLPFMFLSAQKECNHVRRLAEIYANFRFVGEQLEELLDEQLLQNETDNPAFTERDVHRLDQISVALKLDFKQIKRICKSYGFTKLKSYATICESKPEMGNGGKDETIQRLEKRNFAQSDLIEKLENDNKRLHSECERLAKLAFPKSIMVEKGVNWSESFDESPINQNSHSSAPKYTWWKAKWKAGYEQENTILGVIKCDESQEFKAFTGLSAFSEINGKFLVSSSNVRCLMGKDQFNEQVEYELDGAMRIPAEVETFTRPV